MFAVTGAGLYFYFESEKAAVAARKAAETATAKFGRPRIGGPFVLQDQNGNNFSDKNLVGKWSLVYVSHGGGPFARAVALSCENGVVGQRLTSYAF